MHRTLYQGEIRLNSTLLLSGSETHHVLNVLRSKEGDVVEIINGKGILGIGNLAIKGKQCSVFVQHITLDPQRSKITLAFGISKGGALDFIIHRCTELGVLAFQPLATQNSFPAKGWNADRWEKVVTEVSKQCQELHFPDLLEPQTFKSWLQNTNPKTKIVYCDEGQRSTEGRNLISAESVILLVGAEGGWSPNEIESLQKIDAVPMGLGKNRLRAETASLVALTLLKKEMNEV